MVFNSLCKSNNQVSFFKACLSIMCLMVTHRPKGFYTDMTENNLLHSKTDSVLICFVASFDFDLLRIRIAAWSIVVALFVSVVFHLFHPKLWLFYAFLLPLAGLSYYIGVTLSVGIAIRRRKLQFKKVTINEQDTTATEQS